MPPFHKIHFYKDGYLRINYCIYCSSEGDDLLEDCPRKVKIKVQQIDVDDKINLDSSLLKP